MRRLTLFSFLLFFLYSSGLVHAQDRCVANEKIHAALKQAKKLGLDSFEVNLGKVNPNLRPQLMTKSSKVAQPLVFFYQNGVNIIEKDTDPDDECWDLFFTYVVGQYVYLGAIAANYEMTDEPVQIVWDLQGPKNKVIKKSKKIPSLSLIAYFVRQKLAGEAGTYALTTRTLSRRVVPFLLLYELSTFFYVQDIEPASPSQ